MKTRVIKQGLLLAAIAAAVAPGAFAQTTATADKETTKSAALPTSAAELLFSWQPGQRLVYETSSTAEVKAAVSRNEGAHLKTTLTVLEKSGEVMTVLAQTMVGEVFTTGVGELEPGPAYTVEIPQSGVDPLQEVKSAGLTGSASPAFSATDVLTALPGENQTSQSVLLPVVNDLADSKVNRSQSGDQITVNYDVKAAANSPGYSKTAVYSRDKKAYVTLDSSSSASMQMANGQTASFSVSASTKLVSSDSVPADQLAALKSDISAGIPVITKLRTLSMSEPAVIGAAVKEMDSYIAAHPQGVFASAMKDNRDMLAGMAKRAENWSKIKVGEAAPAFEAKTIDGKIVSLSALKGKVVLLDFWATWCGPCVMEMPNVKKLYDEFKNQNFEIVGFSADRELTDLTDFVKEQNLTWPQVFEGDREDDSVMFNYGVMQFPTTVLVDKEGKIAVVDARAEELHKAVEKLVKGAAN